MKNSEPYPLLVRLISASKFRQGRETLRPIGDCFVVVVVGASGGLDGMEAN